MPPGVIAVPEGVCVGRVCPPGPVWSGRCDSYGLVRVRRGAAGRRFRRVPLDVNGTPDGRYVTDKRGAAVARGGCAWRGKEVCLREPDRANGDPDGALPDTMVRGRMY